MKYFLQLHTGSYGHAGITAKEALRVISDLTDRLDVSGVIWGWTKDDALNEALCDFSDERGLQSYFWLPVFSEVMDVSAEEPFVFPSGENNTAIVLNEDESFEFGCPKSKANIDHAIKMYETITGKLHFTGVFLDRIRYPSAANSRLALGGCRCALCMKEYEEAHVNIAHVDQLLKRDVNKAMYLTDLRSSSRYGYQEKDIDLLWTVKRRIITGAIERLSTYFHARGLSVGVDTFAPALADFVCQDLDEISEFVDFMKPMIYRRTNAPAGMTFEEKAVFCETGENNTVLQSIWGGSIASDAAVSKQIAAAVRGRTDICPGIEINRFRSICDTDAEYVTRSTEIFEKAGCSCAVLSWNVSHMDPEICRALEKP